MPKMRQVRKSSDPKLGLDRTWPTLANTRLADFQTTDVAASRR